MVWQRMLATTVVVVGLLTVSHGASQSENPPILALLLPDGSSFLEDTGGTVVVRILHASGTGQGASGAIFRIRASVGFTGVILSEEYPPGSFWIGNVTDGLLLILPSVFCDIVTKL